MNIMSGITDKYNYSVCSVIRIQRVKAGVSVCQNRPKAMAFTSHACEDTTDSRASEMLNNPLKHLLF